MFSSIAPLRYLFSELDDPSATSSSSSNEEHQFINSFCEPTNEDKETAAGDNSTNHLSFKSSNDEAVQVCKCKKRQRRVVFRPLKEGDKDTIRSLHEEWFPVRYKDDFYDSLITNKMAGSGEPLFSSVALLVPEDDEGKNESYEEGNGNTGDGASAIDIENGSNRVIGCVVGSFVRSSRAPSEIGPLLIKNPHRHSQMFYIMTLGATTEFRKMGLGTALVERCLQLAKRNKRCGVVYLHVITYNNAAIRFYEKLGFVRVTEIKDYYTIEGVNYNCYLYAKYIHGNQVTLSKGFFTILADWVTSVWNTLTFPFYSALRLE
mmetsp:Transcript_30112/g.36795  ORF Transcript_30112/g.36795 Transcript_30112/m.36795 type:complete len:319 (+) Transcript_30112:13-969(+)